MLFTEHKIKPKCKHLTFLHLAESEGLFHDPSEGVDYKTNTAMLRIRVLFNFS